ncbi:MAG: aldehyde dehydrogenase [Rhizobiaceae bacterium]|nr:aldehyde dehydrogenase [Rhizobiaceae bacterium]
MRRDALHVVDNDAEPVPIRLFERLDPVTHEVVTQVPAATTADALKACNNAARAFGEWSATSPTERRAILNRAADLLVERIDAFSSVITAETGATRDWGAFNCRFAATILREAASTTTQQGGEVIPSDHAGTTSITVRQPVGVVLSIAPWNAPVILGVRAVAAPLASGNSVILKASELCPGTHDLIGKVLHDAGVPAGALTVLHTLPDDVQKIVETIVSHDAVRRVNFTGSTRVGRIVAEIAARHLKRCLLELGGKAPIIVLDDADLERAVDAAAYGAFINQGQVCISTDRVLVDEEIAEEFVSRLAARAVSLRASDPRDPDCGIGAMISEQSAMRIKGLVDDAVVRGAELAAGGRQEGVFVDPVVLDRVTPAMRIYYEETFGPVASVIRFSGAEEAISIANDTEYGLGAAVYSRDMNRALEIAKRIETGFCHINATTLYDEPQMPFGGMKSSGYGRFGGRAGIEEFTELRWISMRSEPEQYRI